MAFVVIHLLQGFSNAGRQTVVQQFTRFELPGASRGPSAIGEHVVGLVWRAFSVTSEFHKVLQ